jgi:hypothetical protein
MVTFDCPWCTEPVGVEASSLDELVCDTCGVTVEIAPDPAQLTIDRAA